MDNVEGRERGVENTSGAVPWAKTSLCRLRLTTGNSASVFVTSREGVEVRNGIAKLLSYCSCMDKNWYPPTSALGLRTDCGSTPVVHHSGKGGNLKGACLSELGDFVGCISSRSRVSSGSVFSHSSLFCFCRRGLAQVQLCSYERRRRRACVRACLLSVFGCAVFVFVGFYFATILECALRVFVLLYHVSLCCCVHDELPLLSVNI